MKKIFFAITTLSIIYACSSSQKSIATSGKKSIEQRVDSVLRLMTTEEKIGQMTQFTSDWDVTGPTMRAEYKSDIRKGRVGSIFNAHTAKYNRELQRVAVEETRMKIPLLFGYDVIHGYKTIFPIPLGETASGTPADLDLLTHCRLLTPAKRPSTPAGL